MRSKIEIELKANGTLLDITQGEDKIFQGAVGVTEYHLSVADGITGDYNWRPTDIVYMSLKRNDGQTAQVKMTAENGGWVWTSNGWETDVDISGTGNLEVSFICKRYSLVSVGTVAFEKTTEKIDLIVYESAGYVPQNIDIEIAEELQEAINVLQLDKVGRYSVSEENLPYLPAEIVYDLDGAKTPNNVYFDFTNNVRELDGALVEKQGGIIVLKKGDTQVEFFLTLDGGLYSREIIEGVASEFKSTTVDEFNKYYTKLESDARFVHLTGNEAISGTKTFTDSPVIPNASANTHAVNRSDMYGYTYSKGQIRDLTQAVVFETQAQFENWLAGTYTRPDGYVPADLIVGKTVIIEETSPNWLCIHTPATSLSDFEEKAEDVKFLSEINAMPYKSITANNGQSFVNELKDQVDLKAQIIEIEDLTIETTDWVNDSGNIYFDYENENFTDPTKQFFEFVSNDKVQNEVIDGFSILAAETILDGADYKVRLFANKVPNIDIVLRVNLINYTEEVFEAGEITANKIIYSNTTSGLIATEVQGAIDELKGITDDLESDKVDKTAIKQTTGSSTTDIMSQKAISDELGLKVDKSSIKQVTGSSTTDLMSQKAITDELGLKSDKTYVDNELGKKVDNPTLTYAPNANLLKLKGNAIDGYEPYWSNPNSSKTINLSFDASGDIISTGPLFADGFKKWYRYERTNSFSPSDINASVVSVNSGWFPRVLGTFDGDGLRTGEIYPSIVSAINNAQVGKFKVVSNSPTLETIYILTSDTVTDFSTEFESINIFPEN